MKNKKKMHKYISKVSEGTADARCSVHTHTHARTHTRGPRTHTPRHARTHASDTDEVYGQVHWTSSD